MTNIFAELSRRNVFRVAIAYVIVGWIVLQVGTLMFSNFGAPDWVAKVFTLLIILGFPIAMLLSWAFELTPEGVRKSEGASEDLPAPPKPKIMNDTGHQTSIAVLAFVNMSGDPENEYFSDGISEEILNALAGIKSMRVAARTSAFSFKGRNEDVREIGETLDVANVLEGSVRRHGDRVRVTAQLINVANGYHLWSSTYDRELIDIFAIQEEIAQAITRALKIELNVEEKDQIARQGTESIEAYSAYLKSLDTVGLGDLDLALEAVGHLKRAVEIDPGYADAWGQLAIVYALSHIFQPFADLEDDLEAAFSIALKLNPDEPRGLAAKAYHTVITIHDWKSAGELYRRALAIDPGGTNVRLYTGYYLSPLGRMEEANALYQAALRRDPLNAQMRWDYGFFNSFPGYDNAITLEQMNQLLAAGDNATGTYCLRATVLAVAGRKSEALEDLAKAGVANDPWDLFQCAVANHLLGQDEAFGAILVQMKERSKVQYGYDHPLATLYSTRRDYENLLDQMEKSLAIREFGTSYARIIFRKAGDKYQSDPRYLALLKELRLDDASLAEMGMKWGGPDE